MSITLKSKEVTIRKPRYCIGCMDKHDPGARMVYWVGIFEGEFQANYACLPCNAYMSKYSSDFSDGISEGDLKGEIHYEQFKLEFLKSDRNERS